VIQIPRKRVAVAPIVDPTHAGAEYADPKLGAPVDLWIPDDARERCDQGIVKYVGAEVTEVKIGDYVIFSGYVGTLVNIDGERIIIMPEDFIQATLLEPSTDVPGLYFRGQDGTYFTATYEQAVELMSRAFRDAPWHRGFRVTSYAPRPEEYDKLKAGSG
jgi:hypothetical protein